MENNPAGPESQEKPVTLPVDTRDMDQVPISGCDHTHVTGMPTDDSVVVQVFSTVPPLLDVEGRGNMPDVVVRKCIGQFHFTPKGALDLANKIQEVLNKVERGKSA